MAVLCTPADRRFVLSDLAEEFERMLQARGKTSARRWYRRQVVRSTLPLLGQRLGRLGTALPGRIPWRSTRARRGDFREPANVPDLFREVGFALRTLRRTPLAILITVASLAIGIGASTSVFTIANAFLFQESTGLADTDDLMAVYTSDERGNLYDETSFQDYLSVAEEVEAFDGAAAYRAGVLSLGEGEGAERVIVEIVTGNYFDILGIRPPLGRGFLPDETQLGGAQRVIVLSHEAWQQRLAGSRSAIGRTVTLDGEEFTVVGVAPEGLLSRLWRLKVYGWVPVGIPGGTYHSTPRELEDREDRDYLVMAHLAPGATPQQAETQLASLANRLRQEYPDAWEDDRGQGRVFTLLSERDSRAPPNMRAALAGASAFLLAGALLILLIACSNVASLFLARAQRRRREMAVRLSLGATRGRLVRMLLLECLVVALAGGALGVLLAHATTGLVDSLPLPIDVAVSFDVGLDYRVVVFALLVSVGAAGLFGLAPAMRGSRPDLVPALKGEPGSEGGRRPGRLSLRSLLVMAQVAASLILLVTAGLFLRSLRASASMDIGLDPDRVAVMSKEFDPEVHGPDEGQQLFLNLAARLEGFPGVEAVALAGNAEASLWGVTTRAVIEVPGFESAEGGLEVVPYNPVTPGYLEMLDMTLLRGRTFDEGDRFGAPLVAVVNETFAKRYWAGMDPLGRWFTVARTRQMDTPTETPSRSFEVVGVIRDFTIPEEGDSPPPLFWTSFLQDYSPMMVIHLKGRTSAEAMVPILRREVERAHGEVGLIEPTPYRQLAELRFIGYRLGWRLLSYAGAFALILALIGIYGIVSFAVTQRLREMAIRQAMGAHKKQVVITIVRDGMTLTLLGMLAGAAVVIPLSILIRSTLYGVGALDLPSLGGAFLLLLCSALAATLVPALRTIRVDPMLILREE
jgi:predicted permease